MRHGPKIGKTRQTLNEICSSLPYRGNFSKGNRDEFPQNQTFPENHKIIIFIHTHVYIYFFDLKNIVKLFKFNDFTFDILIVNNHNLIGYKKLWKNKLR